MSPDYEDVRFYAAYETDNKPTAVYKIVVCPKCQSAADYIGPDGSKDGYYCPHCDRTFTK